MRSVYTAIIIALLLALVPSSSVFAQGGTGAGDVPKEVPDGARFRWATALQLGGIIFPTDKVTVDNAGQRTTDTETLAYGFVGFTTDLGVQLNDEMAIYLASSLDIVFGDLTGINVSAALIYDYTLMDGALTIGGGPDVGWFGAIGVDDDSASAAGGAMYGARTRASYNLFVSRDADGPGRSALSLGLDLRFLAGAGGEASAGTSGASASGTSDLTFFFSPVVFVAYRGF